MQKKWIGPFEIVQKEKRHVFIKSDNGHVSKVDQSQIQLWREATHWTPIGSNFWGKARAIKGKAVAMDQMGMKTQATGRTPARRDRLKRACTKKQKKNLEKAVAWTPPSTSKSPLNHAWILKRTEQQRGPRSHPTYPARKAQATCQ